MRAWFNRADLVAFYTVENLIYFSHKVVEDLLVFRTTFNLNFLKCGVGIHCYNSEVVIYNFLNFLILNF